MSEPTESRKMVHKVRINRLIGLIGYRGRVHKVYTHPFYTLHCRICIYVHPLYIYTCIYTPYIQLCTPHTPLNTLYTPYIHHCRYAGLRHISQLYLDTNRLSGSIPGTPIHHIIPFTHPLYTLITIFTPLYTRYRLYMYIHHTYTYVTHFYTHRKHHIYALNTRPRHPKYTPLPMIGMNFMDRRTQAFARPILI